MILLNGLFLFELVLLNTLYEFFIQDCLSVELQNSKFDNNYKEHWFKACVNVITSSHVHNVMQLVDFCTLLFDKYPKCRKNIYINDKIKPQIFGYSIEYDKNCGFSRRHFIKVLTTIKSQSRNINDFINEIIQLLEHIEYIVKEKKIKNINNNNIIIYFQNYMKYKNLFKYIPIQFEFISPKQLKGYLDFDNNNNILFIYAIINKLNILKKQQKEDKFHLLEFEIIRK